MQALRSRGMMLLGEGAGGEGGVCYAVTASYSACGWLVSLHAPLILHNALLSPLEYELSDTNVAAGEQSRTSVGVLARDAQVAIYRPCRPGLYLRARSAGFHWSQPHDIGSTHADEAGQEGACALRCPPAQSVATHFGPIEHGAPDLSLQMRAARSPHSVAIEVSGQIWVSRACLDLTSSPRRPKLGNHPCPKAPSCAAWPHATSPRIP